MQSRFRMTRHLRNLNTYGDRQGNAENECGVCIFLTVITEFGSQFHAEARNIPSTVSTTFVL